MEPSRANSMEHLVTELNILLRLLDHETLSSATVEKTTAVKNLLKHIQLSVNRKDINTSLYRNGTSFVESLFKDFDYDLKDLTNAEESKDLEDEGKSKMSPFKSSPAESPPPLPATTPPEDYYEEAVPLSPGKVPQYITTHSSSSLPNSLEDGYYEDADINYPATQIDGPHKNSDNDSDAPSSSYESYDEEEEEAKARRLTPQWPSGEKSGDPVKDCRVCAFLLRKKRFGQWAKQLTVIYENRLLCFKSSKDRNPYIDLPLDLCNVIYVPKDGRRKKHELRFSLPGGEALVLAVQSKEQAEVWLKIIREVSSQGTGYGLDGSVSPHILRKMEMDQSQRYTSDSDNVATGGSVSPSFEHGKAKRGALSELTGSMGRAAGRKITRIISFSKKKPTLARDPLTLSSDDPRCGYLNVLMNQCWNKQWCCVQDGSLYFYWHREEKRSHITAVALHGCEVAPGLGPEHPFGFRVLQEGVEVVGLEASCSEEMGRWLGVLLAETGCSSDPDTLHYDYVDIEAITDLKEAVRHSFLWMTSSSSASADSMTYDEVPYEALQPEEQVQKPGADNENNSSSSRKETQRDNVRFKVNDHTSSVTRYGKYGKTRAEKDACRYLCEKEELEMERDLIRRVLHSFRNEKRMVKEELKSASGSKQEDLEKRLVQLEEGCRGKEEERVDLELRLTEVKENLKKSLAGGVLGAPTERLSIRKFQRSKTERPNTEPCSPFNCSSEIRKCPLSIYTSTPGNVMKKAKEWESKRGT